MKLLFARHGESLANTLHVISNRDLPHPLTEAGCAQAAALAGRITLLRGASAPLIFASPVPRARQTAEILAASLGNLPVRLHPGLAEYDCGSLEGRGDEAAWREHNRFFHDWLEGCRRDEAPAGGETFEQIRARLLGFVDDLAREYGARKDVEIVCVSHGGTLRLGLPGLLRNVSFEFTNTHGIGHVELVEAFDRDGAFYCRAWGDVIFQGL